MYDKFGEMGSAEELNELAENLKKEGDLEGLKTMAEENGLSHLVDLFVEGTIPCLCYPFDAASGKLDVEAKELGLKGLMLDWVEYLRSLCMKDAVMAAAVRKKGKTLSECMGKLLEYSFRNRVPVDKRILDAAKSPTSRVDFGIPGIGEAKKMIREFYLGGAE